MVQQNFWTNTKESDCIQGWFKTFLGQCKDKSGGPTYAQSSVDNAHNALYKFTYKYVNKSSEIQPFQLPVQPYSLQ